MFFPPFFTSECSSARATSSCRRFCAVCRLCLWTWASAMTKKHQWCMRRERRKTRYDFSGFGRKKKNPVTKKPQQRKLFSKSQRAFRVCADEEDGGDRVDSRWLEKRENRGCKYSSFGLFWEAGLGFGLTTKLIPILESHFCHPLILFPQIHHLDLIISPVSSQEIQKTREQQTTDHRYLSVPQCSFPHTSCLNYSCPCQYNKKCKQPSQKDGGSSSQTASNIICHKPAYINIISGTGVFLTDKMLFHHCDASTDCQETLMNTDSNTSSLFLQFWQSLLSFMMKNK